jgi:hypothetical protein
MDNKIITKDRSILALVEHLQIVFGKHAFKIKDHWDGDLCAIGFTNLSETALVYVSTFGSHHDQYSVRLEATSKDYELSHYPERDLDNISWQELEKVFKKHLEL